MNNNQDQDNEKQPFEAELDHLLKHLTLRVAHEARFKRKLAELVSTYRHDYGIDASFINEQLKNEEI